MSVLLFCCRTVCLDYSDEMKAGWSPAVSTTMDRLGRTAAGIVTQIDASSTPATELLLP